MYKFLKKPYTLAGFKPGIFCSVGGRDDHYTTPPGLHICTYVRSCCRTKDLQIKEHQFLIKFELDVALSVPNVDGHLFTSVLKVKKNLVRKNCLYLEIPQNSKNKI
jgi:hypothetical protein